MEEKTAHLALCCGSGRCVRCRRLCAAADMLRCRLALLRCRRLCVVAAAALVLWCGWRIAVPEAVYVVAANVYGAGVVCGSGVCVVVPAGVVAVAANVYGAGVVCGSGAVLR